MTNLKRSKFIKRICPRSKNMQQLLISIAMISYIVASSAQTNIDSLLQVLSKSETSNQAALIDLQLRASVKLFSEHRAVSDSILKESLSLLETYNDINLLVRARLMKINRLPKAKKSEEEFLALASLARHKDISPEVRVDVLYRQGIYLYSVRKCKESVKVYNEAIRLAKEHSLPAYANLLIAITSPIIYQEDHYTAMSYFLSALEVDGDHHGRVYAAIPNVCRKMEDWENMVKYGYIGLADAKEKKKYKREVFSLMQLGYAYMKQHDYTNARKYTEEAWRISKERKFFNRAGIIITTLIQTELEDGNIDKAIGYEKELVHGGNAIAVPSIYNHLAMAYLEKGDVQKAIDYCEYALDNIGAKNEQPYDIALYKMEAYGCLSEAYHIQKKYKKAYDARLLHENAKEVIKGKGAILNISKALNQQELAQQEKILKLEKDQAVSLYNEKINRYKISGLLGLLLLTLGGFTMYQLRKRNAKIAAQNEIISKALSEKDLLLREIHHRVKNNLQLVSSLLTLQGRSIDDETAQLAIKEGQSRVRSMALIHQDLYNKENLTDIGVKQYVEKLTQELFDTYRIDKDRISLHRDVDNIEMDVDALVPLGLIINELITNSLKYAFPDDKSGQLTVSLKSVSNDDSKLQLIVKDNGIGYDPAMTRDNSFGSTLITALVEQLEGTTDHKIQLGEGTEVAILISL